MGTDPNPPETQPGADDDAPETTTPPSATTGTEPAPVDAPETTDEPVTEDPAQAGADDAPEGDGIGEPLDRKTTLADDAAPAGHLTDTEDGPRQHGDVNPELGVAPDELAGTARPRGDQASEGLTEPDQIETDRPDVGTTVSDEPPAPLDDDESEED